MKKAAKLIDKIIAKFLTNQEIKKYDDSSLLIEDLGFDSLKLVSLFSELSDELKIDILSMSDTDLFNVKSVIDLKKLFIQFENQN